MYLYLQYPPFLLEPTTNDAFSFCSHLQLPFEAQPKQGAKKRRRGGRNARSNKAKQKEKDPEQAGGHAIGTDDLPQPAWLFQDVALMDVLSVSFCPRSIGSVGGSM